MVIFDRGDFGDTVEQDHFSMKSFRNMFSFFFSPSLKFDDEGKKLIFSYLNIILLVNLSVLPVFILLKVIHSGSIQPEDFVFIGLELFLLVILYIGKRGSVKVSALLYLIISWTALTAAACFADGVQDLAIVGYIIIIFLATLLIGIRVAIAITTISIVSVWVLGFAQVYGMLIPEGDKPLNYSRNYTFLFILVLTVIILFARSYRHFIERINSELKERIKAQEELSKKEIRLMEQNEELMIAKEKAEESDRLKTAFLQNISHEIRTPMNGIVGFLELLQQPGIEEEEKKEYIEVVNSCTGQLSNMVSDFIDISKIETGSLELFLSVFSLSEFKKEIEEEWGELIRDKGLAFSVSNEEGGENIKTDRSKIHQILSNLIGNSLKFTRSGGINIRFARLDGCLSVSVADTGIGIEEDHRVLIFDRFRQAEFGLSRSYGGTGLGLAISKGYVEFLGGTIEVDSQPMAGSVFTFKVPVEFLSE